MSSPTSQGSFATPFDVPPGYNGKTPFSPEIPRDFIGIKIAAPPVVLYTPGAAEADAEGRFAYVPISMRYQFKGDYIGKFDYIDEHMVVVAVNSRTGESYTSSLKYEDRAPIDPDENRLPPEEAAKYLDGRYFTFDLNGFLNLPEKEAVYHVHVTLEKYQSNVVKIEIKKRGK